MRRHARYSSRPRNATLAMVVVVRVEERGAQPFRLLLSRPDAPAPNRIPRRGITGPRDIVVVVMTASVGSILVPPRGEAKALRVRMHLPVQRRLARAPVCRSRGLNVLDRQGDRRGRGSFGCYPGRYAESSQRAAGP